MSEKITVPTLGESVTEATVSKWLKSVGEEVITDEPIVELETDKVNVEVPSPSNGILENISVNEGDTVQVGALLGNVGKNSSDSVNVKKEKEYTPPKKQEEAKEIPLYNEEPPKQIKKTKAQKKTKTNNLEPLILSEEPEELKLVLRDEDEKPIRTKTASPSARKLAQEKNIDLNQITGSGKRGTVLKEDLLVLVILLLFL